jgi:hypothetical protein
VTSTRELAERLTQFWRITGAEPKAGVDAGAYTDFRLHNGLSIPRELAEFYGVTNGIESDANLFCVWGLGEVRRVPERLGDCRGIPDYGPITKTLPHATSYFAFADYMMWSHVFAVRVTDEVSGTLGPVVWVCGSEYGLAAQSFAAFWERYLADPLDAVIV